MNPKFKKVLGDLTINPARMAVIIAALIIGLWGVGSVLVSYSILSGDLDRNFLGTDPQHASIASKDFSRLTLREIRDLPYIEKAEFRDFAVLRIETHPDEWIPLWLFGVEDFRNFNLARFYDGKGRGHPVIPGDGEAVIERDGLKFSDLKAGLKARVRPGGKVMNINIAGIVFDPAQSPGTQDHLIYAYVNKKTFTEITGLPSGKQLIIRYKDAASRNDVQVKTGMFADFLREKGILTDRINIPIFESHPHQWQLNTLLFLVGSVGFLAFLMGAALVSQLMAAILSRQIRQIGILKAIGASRMQIILMYTVMVLALGAVSGIIAIPLAVRFGYAYSYFVADIINFEILTLTLPAWIYAGLIAAGLLLPVLLSLPAIFRGTRISVLKALNSYGISADMKTGGFSRLPGWLPNGLIMGLRNTVRSKRLIVTVVSMALGAAIFNAGFNVQKSVRHLLVDVDYSMKHDVQVVFSDRVPKEKALEYFTDIGNIKRIETWNGGRGVMQSMAIAADDGVGIVSLPYGTDLIGFKSIKGRWIGTSEKPEIVLNQEAAVFYDNPQIGSYMNIYVGGNKITAKLVGIVQESEKSKIYIDEHIYDAAANPDHYVNNLMFVAENRSYDKVMTLKRDIERAIAPTDLQILYVMMQAERVKIIYDHMYIILVALIFSASLVLIVSAIGMASAVSINIMERTREIGVLRAIGATPRKIYGLFVTEGMIISAAGIILGMILSLPLSIAAAGFFGKLMLDVELQPAFSVPGLAITLVSTLIFSWLASRIPARGAISISTREALDFI